MTILKNAALSLIAKGMRFPDNALNRCLELFHLRRLLQTLKVNCVLDVGANCGQFALELRKLGYQGRIISFEPSLDVFKTLQKTFRHDKKWTGHQMALGAEEGLMKLNVVPHLTVMNSLLEMQSNWPGLTTEEVQVRRLDRLLPAILSDIGDRRIFLKMDTQGYDLQVFEGASDCLDSICGLQSEPSIQPVYQQMPHYIEALSVYENAGFELYNMSVVCRIADGGLQELNCFMKRRTTVPK
jgi:FkbM family methyltransferase